MEISGIGSNSPFYNPDNKAQMWPYCKDAFEALQQLEKDLSGDPPNLADAERQLERLSKDQAELTHYAGKNSPIGPTLENLEQAIEQVKNILNGSDPDIQKATNLLKGDVSQDLFNIRFYITKD